MEEDKKEDVKVEQIRCEKCTENNTLHIKIKELSQKYHVESIAVKTMEQLLYALNSKHVKETSKHSRQIKVMQCNCSKKIYHAEWSCESKEKCLKLFQDRFKKINQEH